MAWGLIRRPFINVPWTTPPILGHYLVTGGDWRAAVWGAVSIADGDGRVLPVRQGRDARRGGRPRHALSSQEPGVSERKPERLSACHETKRWLTTRRCAHLAAVGIAADGATMASRRRADHGGPIRRRRARSTRPTEFARLTGGKLTRRTPRWTRRGSPRCAGRSRAGRSTDVTVLGPESPVGTVGRHQAGRDSLQRRLPPPRILRRPPLAARRSRHRHRRRRRRRLDRDAEGLLADRVPADDAGGEVAGVRAARSRSGTSAGA